MAETKNVLIIGCGWLGKITAQLLLNTGYSVTGTTRTEDRFSELEELGISPLKLEITPNKALSIPNFDVVLIAVSPGRGEQRNSYPNVMEVLAKALSTSNAQVLMCSSTSVYGDIQGLATESDARPDSDHQHAILAAEGFLRKHIPDAVILRLGGLYGPDRHPVKYLAGRKGITQGDAPVNLVHSDDAAGSIKKLIDTDTRTEIFNVVAPAHPSRSELYTTKAKEFGLDEPEFEAGGKDEKVVDSTKLIGQLGYEFKVPNPLDS